VTTLKKSVRIKNKGLEWTTWEIEQQPSFHLFVRIKVVITALNFIVVITRLFLSRQISCYS